MQQQADTKEQLIESLKVRSVELSQQIRANEYNKEYFNAKARHLKSQLALTERHLEELGVGQSDFPRDVLHPPETPVGQPLGQNTPSV